MAEEGRVEGIWLKRSHRGPMDSFTEATLVEGKGIAGSIDRSRRRQVSILAREDWDAGLADVGGAADPSRRRANVVVTGVALADTRGRVLAIGDARIVVGGELTPCERLEEVHPGLQRAMMTSWRGGVFGQVVAGGVIRVGDVVSWQEESPRE